MTNSKIVFITKVSKSIRAKRIVEANCNNFCFRIDFMNVFNNRIPVLKKHGGTFSKCFQISYRHSWEHSDNFRFMIDICKCFRKPSLRDQRRNLFLKYIIVICIMKNIQSVNEAIDCNIVRANIYCNQLRMLKILSRLCTKNINTLRLYHIPNLLTQLITFIGRIYHHTNFCRSKSWKSEIIKAAFFKIGITFQTVIFHRNTDRVTNKIGITVVYTERCTARNISHTLDIVRIIIIFRNI